MSGYWGKSLDAVLLNKIYAFCVCFKLIHHNSVSFGMYIIYYYNYIQDMNSAYNVILVSIIVSQSLLFIRMLTTNMIMFYSICAGRFTFCAKSTSLLVSLSFLCLIMSLMDFLSLLIQFIKRRKTLTLFTALVGVSFFLVPHQ